MTESPTTGEPLRCPSARCEPGAAVLAVLTSAGRLAHVSPPIPVDEAFASQAAERGTPEARMRFTSACVEERCIQWTGSSCRAIEQALAIGADAPLPDRLPRCAIRPSCRWHRQEGRAACRVCPLVLTDATDE